MEEIKGNLFSVDEGISLCHCVSRDLEMGRGIAVVFKKKFGRVNELVLQHPEVGKGAFVKDGERTVFYLVTKENYWEKPRLMDLLLSITWMRDIMVKNGIKTIAMPRLECGLDKLDWAVVKPSIESIFENSGIKVMCFYI